jgi:hypothetical protein
MTTASEEYLSNYAASDIDPGQVNSFQKANNIVLDGHMADITLSGRNGNCWNDFCRDLWKSFGAKATLTGSTCAPANQYLYNTAISGLPNCRL